MKCPKCQTENPKKKKFCHECGAKLSSLCSQCGAEILPGNKFCGECGNKIEGLKEETTNLTADFEGERKHVTVLFSDLSGYTVMSGKLDPEEVKRIMSWIFGEVAQIVTKYEGFIEKFIGDAAMALFGVPQAHEDDPVRAIKAAREIHAAVNAISPNLEKMIGQPLQMHSGINTGLVVTGNVDMERGTHGVVGDTINLASRLADLAEPGEIIVSLETRQLSAPHFKVKELGPIRIKGKAQPIFTYRVEEELEIATTFDAVNKITAIEVEVDPSMFR
jgi:class 3 adenylate cyclase